jgi:hypothetical protein
MGILGDLHSISIGKSYSAAFFYRCAGVHGGIYKSSYTVSNIS